MGETAIVGLSREELIRLAQHLMSRGGANQAIEYVEHALVLKPDSQVGPFDILFHPPKYNTTIETIFGSGAKWPFTSNNLLLYFPRKQSFGEREK